MTDLSSTILAAPELAPGRPLDLPGRGSIVVRDEGPRDAPVIMMLHGWTVTADLNWFEQYPALRPTYRLVAFDHAGHGTGLRPRRRVSIRTLAADAVAVADALEIDRFVALGYSLGGAVAQRIAFDAEDRLHGLVLAATLARFRASELRLWPGVMAALAGTTRMAPVSVVDGVFQRLLANRTTDLHPWAVDQIQRNDPRILLEVGSSLFCHDGSPWLRRLEIPAAVVVTEDDPKVRPHHQRELAELIADVTVHPVAGAHSAPVTSPATFNAGMVDAVASVMARATRPV